MDPQTSAAIDTNDTIDGRVLSFIRDNPAITQGELKEKLGLSIATVKRIMADMQKRGLIESRVTSIPSLRRPELIKKIAMRVADKLGILYVESIAKSVDTVEQKTMENSYQQARNGAMLIEAGATLQYYDVESPGLQSGMR